jgi:hypothetical protein
MIAYATIRDKIRDHLLASGAFGAVDGHQPLAQPTSPVTAAIWAGPVDVSPYQSGMATTKLRLTVFVTIYVPLEDPLDNVEALVVDAVLTVMTLLHGDFELGAQVECVDLLGAAGTSVSAQLGYVRIDDRDYRTGTVTVPLLLADADDLTQTP